MTPTGTRNRTLCLCAVVHDDDPGDERFDELGEVLALYAPGQGIPYSEALTSRANPRLSQATVSAIIVK